MYPYAIDCYLLRSRDGLPPHPEDEPVATKVVHSEEEVKQAKKELLEEHPGGWCVERPID